MSGFNSWISPVLREGLGANIKFYENEKLNYSMIEEGISALSLATYLNDKIGEDWIQEPELVQYHLKNVDFHMTLHDMPNFGSLTLSDKL